MGHPVSWFQIQAKDGKKLIAFYKKVFDWSMSPLPGEGGMQMVEAAEGGIAGGIGSSQDGTSSVSVFVTVADVEAQLSKAERAGAKRALEPMLLPNDMGTIGGFLDPAGNFIGLWKAPDSTPEQPQAAKRAPSKATKNESVAKAKAKVKQAEQQVVKAVETVKQAAKAAAKRVKKAAKRAQRQVKSKAAGVNRSGAKAAKAKPAKAKPAQTKAAKAKPAKTKATKAKTGK